jgi:hypothetical protein
MYSNISASAATIVASGYIEKVQNRICMMLNNYFIQDGIAIQTTATFNATARSIITSAEVWENYGFQEGDDIYIYGSLRNDGVQTVESLSGMEMILTSACSVVNEAFTNSTNAFILFGLIQWPMEVRIIAAKMVAYDYDVRDKISANVKSHSLGPFSETFTDGKEDEFGYPKKLTEELTDFRIARFF